MRRLTRAFLPLISLMLWSIGTLTAAGRQPFFPTAEGQRAEYAVTLDFGRAHLTGVCVAKCLDGEIVGTLMNEFGIRAFDFRCNPHGGRGRTLESDGDARPVVYPPHAASRSGAAAALRGARTAVETPGAPLGTPSGRNAVADPSAPDADARIHPAEPLKRST